MLADRIGTDPLTTRWLAETVDVKPMTISHYLPSKDTILDGMVDQVLAACDEVCSGKQAENTPLEAESHLADQELRLEGRRPRA